MSKNVLRGFGELQCAQLARQLLMHLGSLEVKACQVAVQSKPGCFHMVAHQGNGSLRVFGMQQMLDQPTRGLHPKSPGIPC